MSGEVVMFRGFAASRPALGWGNDTGLPRGLVGSGPRLAGPGPHAPLHDLDPGRGGGLLLMPDLDGTEPFPPRAGGVVRSRRPGVLAVRVLGEGSAACHRRPRARCVLRAAVGGRGQPSRTDG